MLFHSPLFSVVVIVVVAIFLSHATFSLTIDAQVTFTKEQQMQIEEISDKLTRAVREKVEDPFSAITKSKLVRLPDSPRYNGNDDGVELQFCQTGKDDGDTISAKRHGNDPRKKKAGSSSSSKSSSSYQRASLQPLCSRYVIDNFITDDEADSLKEFAEFGMAIGGGAAGGVTLVDFVGSVVSHGAQFANLSMLAQRHQQNTEKQRKSGLDNLQDLKDVIPTTGMLVWLKTVHKIHRLVERVYDTNNSASCSASLGRGAGAGAPTPPRLRYALPAFFSRIDPLPAKTPNDEYWHPHIDTEQYGSFDITTLLYLSNEREDLTAEEFGDFIAGKAKDKLAKNHRHETKEEMKQRILEKEKNPANLDVFHLGGVPTVDEKDEVDARANSNFQGGAFEFLSSRRDNVIVNRGENDDDNKKGSSICHINDDAAESVARIEREGSSCSDKLVVHPKKGRLMVFSSGFEHPHRVEKVREGIRWTSTNAFTCDAKGKSIDVMNDSEFPPKWLSELAARAILSQN